MIFKIIIRANTDYYTIVNGTTKKHGTQIVQATMQCIYSIASYASKPQNAFYTQLKLNSMLIKIDALTTIFVCVLQNTFSPFSIECAVHSSR